MINTAKNITSKLLLLTKAVKEDGTELCERIALRNKEWNIHMSKVTHQLPAKQVTDFLYHNGISEGFVYEGMRVGVLNGFIPNSADTYGGIYDIPEEVTTLKVFDDLKEWHRSIQHLQHLQNRIDDARRKLGDTTSALYFLGEKAQKQKKMIDEAIG